MREGVEKKMNMKWKELRGERKEETEKNVGKGRVSFFFGQS